MPLLSSTIVLELVAILSHFPLLLGDDYLGPDGLPDERRRLRNRQKSVTYRENKKVELKHLKVEATEVFMKCSKTFAIAKARAAVMVVLSSNVLTQSTIQAYLDIGTDERKGAVRLHLATLTPVSTCSCCPSAPDTDSAALA